MVVTAMCLVALLLILLAVAAEHLRLAAILMILPRMQVAMVAQARLPQFLVAR